jgi:hypothetical protein
MSSEKFFLPWLPYGRRVAGCFRKTYYNGHVEPTKIEQFREEFRDWLEKNYKVTPASRREYFLEFETEADMSWFLLQYSTETDWE